MDYAELHAHTNFSFLDGASHPHELVEVAAELGYRALAVTDHHGFYGAAHVANAAKQVGLPIVYGTEIGLPPYGEVVEDSPFAEAEAWDTDRGPELLFDLSEPRRGRTKRMHGTKPVGPAITDHLVLLSTGPDGYGAISKLV